MAHSSNAEVTQRPPARWHVRSAVIIIAVSILYFGVFWFLVPLAFAENDDSAMMMLSSGAYDGTPSPYLVFINYYFGVFLVALYSFTGAIPWYPVVFLAALSLSVGLLVGRFWSRRLHFNFVELALLTLLCLFLTVLTVQMQFTTVAGVSLSIGIWSVLSGPGPAARVAGAVLVVLAFLLRFEAAVLAVMITTPFLLSNFWQDSRFRSRHILLGFVLLGSLVAHFASQQAYRDVAPDYFEFNTLRGDINDNPNADLTPTELPRGVTEIEYELLRGFFADLGSTPLNELRALHAAVEEREAALGPHNFLRSALQVFNVDEIKAFLVLAVILIIAAPSRHVFLMRVFGLSVLLAAFVYVETMAILKLRVIQVGLFAFFVAIFFEPQYRKGLLNVGAIAVVSGAIIFQLGSQASTLKDENVFNATNFHLQRDLVLDWHGDVVVFAGHLYPHHVPVSSRDLDALSGKVFFRGWMVGHPRNRGTSDDHRILEEDVAILVRSDEVGRVKSMLNEGFQVNYGVATDTETVAENEQFSLIAIRRSE
ncbi:MAG: hypothetical protein AAF376_00225 [Pseudomonadota bacterium]